MVSKKCKICSRIFTVHNYRKKIAKFCSVSCHNEARRQGFYPMSEENKKKLSERLKKNNIRPPLLYGKEHPNWKGDETGYNKKHDWIRKHWGRATKCINCKGKNSQTFEWANLSRTYKRERSDWIQLCRSCHIKFDRRKLKSPHDII